MKIIGGSASPLQRLGAASNRILRPFGLRLTPCWRTLGYRRKKVLDEIPINLVLDVGANAGQYGRELRGSGYNGRIVAFEPLSDAFEELTTEFRSDPEHSARNCALGEKRETLSLYQTANSVSSSLLPLANTAYSNYSIFTVSSSNEVPVYALDEIFDGCARAGDKILLKIDAQGYEKAILLGARQSLRMIDAIEIELSLQELYVGQALLPEVVALLNFHGFTCVWLERGYADPRTGDLLQVDGLFRRLQSCHSKNISAAGNAHSTSETFLKCTGEA
jgi:FkbM family methyltransferase